MKAISLLKKNYDSYVAALGKERGNMKKVQENQRKVIHTTTLSQIVDSYKTFDMYKKDQEAYIKHAEIIKAIL